MLVTVILALIVTSSGLLLDNLKYRNCSTALVNTKAERDQSLSHDGCPPWFTNETGECLPGPTLGGIIQHDLLTLQTSLLECYCMTEEDGRLVAGACIYTCKALMGYYPLPCHVSQRTSHVQTCIDMESCVASVKMDMPFLCTLMILHVSNVRTTRTTG